MIKRLLLLSIISFCYYSSMSSKVISRSINLDVPFPKSQNIIENISVSDSLTEKRPLFALKTNLLYDLAITPNLEVEIPLGSRWSINAEFQRGWWLRKSNTFCWQIESGGLEIRYWLGDRVSRKILTGWFTGIFLGSGIYDFQLKKDDGYQGDLNILSGISLGYVRSIARNLNIEFSAGVGYLSSDYYHYQVVDNELIKQGLKINYQAILPLKAKISIVWMLNRREKGGKK